MYTTSSENILFWIVWFIIVLIGSIIFLNFIIAEASASYEKVAGRVEEFISKEKCSLIAESEIMGPGFLKNSYNYPKYIIRRSLDE